MRKVPKTPSARTLAAHVQAALAAGLQAKTTARPHDRQQPAAHVKAALAAATVQAKPRQPLSRAQERKQVVQRARSTVIQPSRDSMLHWEGEEDELVDLIASWTNSISSKPLDISSLSINNGYPPNDHAVVDDDIPDNKAECRSDLKISLTGYAPRYDKWNKYFSTLAYSVGSYVNVFCLWPKGWPAPGPNRFGYLPKGQFAGNPGENEPRSNYPSSTTVRYKGMDGIWYTKTFKYP